MNNDEGLTGDEAQMKDQHDIASAIHQLYALSIGSRSTRKELTLCLELALVHTFKDGNVLCELVLKELSRYRQLGARTIATNQAFVSLQWVNLCLQSDSLSYSHLSALICAQAVLLDTCSQSRSKAGIRKSAQKRTRRSLERLLKVSTAPSETMQCFIDNLTGSTAIPAHSHLLGQLFSLSLVISIPQSVVSNIIISISKYYVAQFVLSKKQISAITCRGLNPYLKLLSSSTLTEELVPAIVKAILRSPEFVVDPVLTQLIDAVGPEDQETTRILIEQFTQPLLNTLKTSSDVTRNAGHLALNALARRSAPFTDQILDKFVYAFNHDRPSTEQRTCLAKLIGTIPANEGRATAHRSALLSMLKNEKNEIVLIALISSILLTLEYCDKHIAEESALLAAVVHGIQDKKATLRNRWSCGLAELVEQYPSVMTHLVAVVMPDVIRTWQHDTTNGVQTLQNGWLSGTCALTTIILTFTSLSGDTDMIAHGANTRSQIYRQDPPFLLLTERVTSRVTLDVDISWLTTALKSILVRGEDDFPIIAEAWCRASLALPYRHSAKETLFCTESVQNQMVLTENLARATSTEIWRRTNVKDCDHTITSELNKELLIFGLSAALSGLKGQTNENFKDTLLLDLIFTAHHPCLGERLFWIELCQLAGRDPAEVITKNLQAVLQRVFIGINYFEHESSFTFSQAGLKSITSIAFVAPQAIVEISSQIAQDLQCHSLDTSTTSVGIWHTPSDQTFVDVLSMQNTRTITNKNVKEWDLLEWENSVRRSVTEKKTVSKKLSKEEQLRFDVQYQLEMSIRGNLRKDVSGILRAVGMIDSINKPYIDLAQWLPKIISCLLGDVLWKSRPYLGGRVAETFLSCSNQLTSLDGEARLLGLAILETHLGVAKDKKLELVNRVLYKLRFESEHRQSQLSEFAYAQVLINAALCSSASSSSGATGCQTEEQVDEQLFLAMEYLNSNVAMLGDDRLNRLSTIEALIVVLENRPSQASDVRTTLQAVFDAIAPTITHEELLIICGYYLSPVESIRNTLLASSDVLDLSDLGFSMELWLSMHDDVQQNADLAKSLFEENALHIVNDVRALTVAFLKKGSGFVRACATRALAHTFTFQSQGMPELISTLFSIYLEAAAEEPVELDRFGQVIERPIKSDLTIATREAVVLSLVELSLQDNFQDDDAVTVIQFLFSCNDHQDRCPVADSAQLVRLKMLLVGTKVIEKHGKNTVEALLPIFESALQHTGSSDKADWIREAAVILYGAAASHLSSDDERVPRVVEQLLKTVSTPSETVQMAISQCLPSLVRKAKPAQDEYIHKLLCLLSDGKTYAERRGAAYGLSGVVKGCGLSVLRGRQVMEHLEDAIHNKKDARARQGALLAYECFASALQNLWEPYLESVIPLLLITFADTDSDVRHATQDTARAIMSNISGFGVQSILPSLLSGLHDHQWRSKKGSVELIGAMAYCAPKQLSFFLPTIVPKLNEVLTDSHAQVRAAGNESLTRFGKVIKNPEIQALVPILLKALSDPDGQTEAALDRLLKTSFLHYIDSPSLSMLIPIIERGMQERVASIKKKSAKIFGLLASLTSPNDLVPHLKSLMPCLQIVLIDTVPDVRATAAKALGSLAEKLGERNFPSLVEDLLDTLNRDVSSTDRQGAAQGLSEVLAGLGLERLEDTLPRILRDSRSRYAYVREGFISLLIYLPATFGTRFAPYLAKSISPILAGLADESEFVRDASLRAGKIMIASYATKSVDLMLPELERGMFHESWRIRVSSLQLVGDLLFKVSGISSQSKTEDEDEDDAIATEAQRNALLEALGQNRRDRIFALLYVTRFDTFALVRSSAINVWKTLVANTPKTLKDILPSLIEVIIQNLSITEDEKRAVYIETLGDLMRKMGRELLLHLLPAFETGLRSSSADRIGVCVAITEILRSGSADQLEDLQDRLVGAVKQVLIDPEPQVRAAANETFEALQAQFGTTVIDRVLPELLALLQSDNGAEEALEALKGLMQSRAHTILPILLPGLLVRPMTAFNLQALSSLVRVAGQALTRRLADLTKTILDAEVKGEAPLEASKTFETILISAPDNAETVAGIMNVMLELCKHDNHIKRARACAHLAVFFSQSKSDFSRYVSDWLRVLISLLNESNSEVIESAWLALDAMTKSLRKEEMAPLVIHLRRAVQGACVNGSNLPGFSLPKGLSAVLPILLQGLLYGSAEQKEEAAAGLGDIVQRTQDESLKGFVTQITGPLIRIIGERSGTEVKLAILTTLRILLQKIPSALKPFLPQLQRTFTKSLADQSDNVRGKAAAALGDLIALQTARIDPLVAELVTGSRHNEPSTQSAMLAALFEVVAKAGSVMSETSKSNVIALIKDLANEQSSTKAADLLGVLFKTLSIDTQAKNLLSEVVLINPPTTFAVQALNGLLLNSSQKIAEMQSNQNVAEYVANSISSTQPVIAEGAVIAAGKILLDVGHDNHFKGDSQLVLALTNCILSCPSNSSDSVRLALIVIRAVAKRTASIAPHIMKVGLAVFSCVRSMVLPVKLAAESAFVAVFQMTDRRNELLTSFLESLDAAKARSIGEYAKRVASKVAAAENEREAAGIIDRDDDIDEIMGIAPESED